MAYFPRWYMYQNIFLQTIHYSLFNSHLIYACQIWGQNQINQLLKKLVLLVYTCLISAGS